MATLGSLETTCFTRVLRTSATNGTGGARVHSSYEVTKIDAKPHQNTSGLSRTHLAGTADALGSRRTTFQSISSTLMRTETKGTGEPERRTILIPDPSLRITHAGAIEISRLD